MRRRTARCSGARRARAGRPSSPRRFTATAIVYVSSGYGVGCNLFKITEAGGKFTAEEVYANKVMDNKHGGVIKVGDYVYGHADGKGWTCQDFKTGEAKWQNNKLGKGSIIYADGRFYLRAEDKGTIVLIEASPDRLQGARPLRAARPQRQESLALPGHRRTASFTCATWTRCSATT